MPRAPCRSATTATTSTRCSTRSAPRTKLVYVCHPNNPTGTMNTRDELDAFFERVPDARARRRRPGVLRVRRPARLPRRRRGVREARPAASSCCARSRRSTASPGSGSATRSGRADVCAAMAKVRRPFDVTDAPRRSPRSRASATPPRSRARRRAQRRRASRGSRRRCASTASSRSPARSGTSSTSSVGEDAAAALRAAAPRGRDRAAAARLRRSDRDPRLRRHARGARRLRGRARPGPCASLARTSGGSASTASQASASAARASSAPTAASGFSSSRRFGSGIGNWLAVVALQVDVYDRTHSGWWVGALLVANILPGGLPRPAARAARRPALAEGADDRLRRRAARRVRRAAVRELGGRRSSPSPRSPASATRSSGRPCSPGCRTSSSDERLPTRERAAPARRVDDDGDRADRRRRHRRRVRARPRLLGERRHVRALGAARARDPGPAAAERPADRRAGTGASWPRASASCAARARCSAC